MTKSTRKQALLAAPILAAAAFVWQPAFADDKAIDRAANQADRALNDAGNELNRAADRAGQTAADATNAAGANLNDAAAQVAGARDSANNDQKAVAHLADLNNFEVRAGQLAQERAQRDDIKQFARQMVEQHTQAQQDLQQLARQKNWQLSEELMPACQAKLDALGKVDARNFDRAYLYGQVGGHTEAALWLRDGRTESQDADLRQYVSGLYTNVEQHRQHAARLANANAGEAVPAGARIDREYRDGVDRPDAASPSTGGGRPERGAAPAPGIEQPPADLPARPQPGADTATPDSNTGGGNPGRGAAPAPGADTPGAGPSAPDANR